MQSFDNLAKGLLAQVAEYLSLPATAFEAITDTCMPREGKTAASSLEAIQHVPHFEAGPYEYSPKYHDRETQLDKGLLILMFPSTEYGLQVLLIAADHAQTCCFLMQSLGYAIYI